MPLMTIKLRAVGRGFCDGSRRFGCLSVSGTEEGETKQDEHFHIDHRTDDQHDPPEVRNVNRPLAARVGSKTLALTGGKHEHREDCEPAKPSMASTHTDSTLCVLYFVFMGICRWTIRQATCVGAVHARHENVQSRSSR
jgi:hypothetical protein